MNSETGSLKKAILTKLSQNEQQKKRHKSVRSEMRRYPTDLPKFKGLKEYSLENYMNNYMPKRLDEMKEKNTQKDANYQTCLRKIQISE